MSSSTFSSWRGCSVGISFLTKLSITETVSDMTTGLRTLSFGYAHSRAGSVLKMRSHGRERFYFVTRGTFHLQQSSDIHLSLLGGEGMLFKLP
jgi:hypothetical protein